MPSYALVLTLRSKVDLIWRSALQLVIAQSIPLSKIVKKKNIDFCKFFSHLREALFLLKLWNKKWGSLYSFLRHQCRKCAPHAFSPIIKTGLGRVSKWQVCGRGKKAQNNPFFQNLHRDITVWTECDKDVNFISIKLLWMLLIMAAILLCAVQNQGITLMFHKKVDVWLRS